jgi:phospholipid transport system transporter-binding protein
MAQVEQLGKGHYRLIGQLDFSTVTALLNQFHAFSLEENISLDLSGLERTNSAGLALMMELLSDAKKQGRKIAFTGLPETMLDLAEMSNVKHLLVPDS